MNRKIKSAVGMLACAAICFGALNIYCTGGYEIVVEGKTLGYVTDEEKYDAVLAAVNQQIEKDFGAEAKLEPDAQFKSCLVAKASVLSDQELYNHIAALSEYMAQGCMLQVEGQDTIPFASEAEMDLALELVERQYQMEQATTGILEEVSSREVYVSRADLYTPETGAAYLEQYELVHVLTEQNVSYQSVMAFNTIEQEDPALYEGQRETVQEGAEGAYAVDAVVRYVNGVEVGKSLLSETLVAEPVDAIVKTGTKEVPQGMGSGTFIFPASGSISSGFGARWGRTHTGIDIAASTGTTIVAADTGVVSFAGEQGTYGLLVKLDHQNGYVTYYAHCSELLVKAGDIVEQGQAIALVGSTGNSTGPHCHFEVRLDNEPQNPSNYVSQ